VSLKDAFLSDTAVFLFLRQMDKITLIRYFGVL